MQVDNCTGDSISARDLAIVVVDLNEHAAGPDTKFARVLAQRGVDLAYFEARVRTVVVPNVRHLLETLRSRGATVVIVRPEVLHPGAKDWPRAYRNQLAALGFDEPSHAGLPNYELLAGLEAHPSDHQIAKHATTAFWGGGLTALCVNRGVRHVLIAGCLTNGGVLATALDAANAGFVSTVLDDGCAALSEEMHRATLELYAPMLRSCTTGAILSRLQES
jgi:nicotinamidase-related amidase